MGGKAGAGIEELISFLQERLARLERYHYLQDWQFFQGEARENGGGLKTTPEPKAGEPGVAGTKALAVPASPVEAKADFLPPGGWRPLPREWDGNQGPAWVRTWVEFPEEIAGIPLAGTRAALEGGIFLGATLYVDGRIALHAPYWTDMRGPQLILADALTPGERHLVVFRFQGRRRRMGEVGEIRVNYARVEEVILDLGAFIEELGFARRVPGAEKVLAEVLALWEERRQAGEGLGFEDWESLRAFIAAARERLSSLQSEIKAQVIHLIGHAHIDMNWMWPWEDTVDTVRRDFTTVDALMEEFPELTFSQSQAAVYKLTEERFPELFRRVAGRIAAGRWETTAATWVEGDLNMASGEAIVRQILYAKKYLRERFGKEPRICWEPDTFGHPATMPQILKKAGLDYYYFMRCAPGRRLFWWEGPEGSRVLAFSSMYNNEIRPERVSAISRELAENWGLKNSLFVYGVGDHGGGPTRDDLRRARFLQSLPGLPTLRFSTAEEFYRAVEAEKPALPVVKGELNFTFDGCYTSHAEIKRWNRECENRLGESETFAALAHWQGASYPTEAFAEAWEHTLFNQFHDIFDGSAIEPSYQYSGALAQRALALAGATGREARAYLVAGRKGVGPDNGETKGEGGAEVLSQRRGERGWPVVVFNSLAWSRSEVVRVRVPAEVRSRVRGVRDGAGNWSPVQVVGEEVLFLARQVPGIGFQTFFLVEEVEEPGSAAGAGELMVKEERRDDGWSKGWLTLQNAFFTLEIDRRTGTIRRLVDRESDDREVFCFKPTAPMGLEHKGEFLAPMPANLFQVLEEMPHPMSSWVIGPVRRQENLYTPEAVELGETGPVMASVRLRYRWGNSTLAQEICLYRGVRRIDFRTHLDWQEVGSAQKDAPMLKVAFTPRLGNSRATYEIPFGWWERVADGREVPALKWVDLSDDAYGVSLLNDGKYGFDVSGNTLRMTLVRSSYEPDPQPDTGVQDFVYALYPHAGDWRDAQTVRRSYELNNPLIAEPLSSLAGNDRQGSEEGVFVSRAYLSVEPANVVVSALKRAETSEDLILRVYEAAGRDTEAEIALNLPAPLGRVSEVDLLEREITAPPLPVGEDGKLRFTIKAWEIRTFRLEKK